MSRTKFNIISRHTTSNINPLHDRQLQSHQLTESPSISKLLPPHTIDHNFHYACLKNFTWSRNIKGKTVPEPDSKIAFRVFSLPYGSILSTPLKTFQRLHSNTTSWNLGYQEQCSQPSGAPVGPGGGTAKTPDETGRQNVVRPRPWIPRTVLISKDDEPHDLRQLLPGDGRGRWKTAENIGKPRKTAGDDGGRGGTIQCRPSSSWPRTDGLPRCEHWSGEN